MARKLLVIAPEEPGLPGQIIRRHIVEITQQARETLAPILGVNNILAVSFLQPEEERKRVAQVKGADGEGLGEVLHSAPIIRHKLVLVK